MSQVTITLKPYKINNWDIVRLPKSESAKLPSRGQVMMVGTINKQPVTLPLEPDGIGSHWFRFDSALQKTTGASADSPLEITLEPTKQWPEPEVPADFKAALDANKKVSELWHAITPMARWEWIRWVNQTNQPQTRQRRIEVSCSKLSNGSRRPCCFNRSSSCVPEVSKNGVLIGALDFKE
jgi:hypothetical protein